MFDLNELRYARPDKTERKKEGRRKRKKGKKYGRIGACFFFFFGVDMYVQYIYAWLAGGLAGLSYVWVSPYGDT